MVNGGIGDRGDWGMDVVGGLYTSEVGSLHDSSRSVRGAGIGVAVRVNHMEWYRFRAKVANTKWGVCCCAFVCRTIVHKRDGVLSTGIERSMWVTKVGMVIWYSTDSAEKVIVSPRSGVCDVVRIMC